MDQSSSLYSQIVTNNHKLIYQSKWLSQCRLVDKLFSKLDPNLDPEIQSTAAQIILDIIAVSYQNIGPPEHLLANLSQAIAAEQLNVSAGTIGGNALIDEMKS